MLDQNGMRPHWHSKPYKKTASNIFNQLFENKQSDQPLNRENLNLDTFTHNP